MNCEDWLKQAPVEIAGDPVWKVEANRLALFAADLGWRDVTKLAGDRRTLGLSDPLHRAVGSRRANASEGYSRGAGNDRGRFYESILGTARESRGWYCNSRFVLGEKVAEHRRKPCTHTIGLPLNMAPDQRGAELREATSRYFSEAQRIELAHAPSPEEIADLLPMSPLP